MKTLITATFASAACAFLSLGCASQGPEPELPVLLEPEPIELGFTGTTTPGDVAVVNLSAQIDGITTLLERGGDDSHRSALVAMLLQRAQVLGAIEDVERAAEVAASIRGDEARAGALASTLSARHEWEAALALLPEPGLDAGADASRESIALARGEDPTAVIEARAARAALEGSFRAQIDLAVALVEAGRYEDADAAYLRALASYRDVSPFAVAFVQFQRGVMWAERAGRPGRAVELYRDAVRRLPDYVVANVHLAELELEMGDRETALARLRRIAAWSEDPEAAGSLASLLAEEAPAEAAEHLARARARYTSLLERHLLAYADHATEFYLDAGADPARALELALVNLENRPTERAYDLAIHAALAAGEQARACELAGRAPSSPRTVPLAETLDALSCTR